jgi:Domain of unknown function (DUF4389)
MDHPIRLIVSDDLGRSRLTVFFRLFLALPHLIWVAIWAYAVYLLAIVNWFVALFGGRLPDGLHSFQARWLRYATHVYAYLLLLADPFPSFSSSASYPIDLEVEGPQKQNRWTVAFRLILAIPAWLLTTVLINVAGVLAFLGWFVCLVTGRMPEGMRNFGAFCLRYQQQTLGYGLLLLTQRYPSLGTGEAGEPAAPVA